MGLLGFLKKKRSDLPMAGQPRSNDMRLSDLPPIDPASVGSSLMENMPTPYDSLGDNGPRSMSVNLPTLDFSMPPPDDLPESSAIDDTHSRLQAQIAPKQGAESLPKLDLSEAPEFPKGFGSELDSADVNKLFKSDEWKEPDWSHYDPYNTEKIDEPTPGDFISEELPKFDDAAVSATPLGEFDANAQEEDTLEPKSLSDEPAEEPGETFFGKQDAVVKPIELYIRGKAYGKVFSELDQMRKSLTKLDNLTENYDEMLKQEEPLMMAAKEQMEYTYRRLSQIDKKIFVQ